MFSVRKYAALLMCCFISTIMFVIGNIYYGFLWAFGFLALGMMLSILIANMLLKNPFTSMLEGQGILAFNFDSTGIIKPFLVKLQPPFIKGKLGKDNVIDVFDRATVWNLTPPVENDTPAKFNEDKTIEIKLSERQYNKSIG